MNSRHQLANPVSPDRAAVCQTAVNRPGRGSFRMLVTESVERDRKHLQNRAASAPRARVVIVRLSEAGRVNRSRPRGHRP
jgi:hypothetical protein